VKHTLAGLTCATMMAASLAACGGSGARAALPSCTGPPTTSTTATSAPTTTASSATATGPVAQVAHSTYTYGGLKVILNLPADILRTAAPRMRLFSLSSSRVWGGPRRRTGLTPLCPARHLRASQSTYPP
jgi:hypothetical protein